ncbi:hypothetical protein GCM10007863_44500 [Dyella mobilis]|nr:hypothetical protein GCM10007863_44500 [Dyella mobilis]
MAPFPFTDLHSFKDYVGFVKLCSPDLYPLREGVQSEDQWSLDLAFQGLRIGIDLYIPRGRDGAKLAKCVSLAQAAYDDYLAGRPRDGFATMADLQRLVKSFPSR